MSNQAAGAAPISVAERACAWEPGTRHLALAPSPPPLTSNPPDPDMQAADAQGKPHCPAFAGFRATHADRPRERLAALGPQGLSDAQLLAIFLGTGVAGKSATELGQTLIRRFGSLRGVLGAPPAALRQVHGIGPAKMSLLRAIGIAAQRVLADDMRHTGASMTPETIASFMKLWIGARPHEVFVCVYLDSHHRMLHYEECSRGSLTRTFVHPRELARNALDWNAASVIIGHNHPSGDPEPSESDRELTRELARTFDAIEVTLLDHLVVGGTEVVSFHERGWL
jgi:DNA repair protein RadC